MTTETEPMLMVGIGAHSVPTRHDHLSRALFRTRLVALILMSAYTPELSRALLNHPNLLHRRRPLYLLLLDFGLNMCRPVTVGMVGTSARGKTTHLGRLASSLVGSRSQAPGPDMCDLCLGAGNKVSADWPYRAGNGVLWIRSAGLQVHWKVLGLEPSTAVQRWSPSVGGDQPRVANWHSSRALLRTWLASRERHPSDARLPWPGTSGSSVTSSDLGSQEEEFISTPMTEAAGRDPQQLPLDRVGLFGMGFNIFSARRVARVVRTSLSALRYSPIGWSSMDWIVPVRTLRAARCLGDRQGEGAASARCDIAQRYLRDPSELVDVLTETGIASPDRGEHYDEGGRPAPLLMRRLTAAIIAGQDERFTYYGTGKRCGEEMRQTWPSGTSRDRELSRGGVATSPDVELIDALGLSAETAGAFGAGDGGERLRQELGPIRMSEHTRQVLRMSEPTWQVLSTLITNERYRELFEGGRTSWTADHLPDSPWSSHCDATKRCSVPWTEALAVPAVRPAASEAKFITGSLQRRRGAGATTRSAVKLAGRSARYGGVTAAPRQRCASSLTGRLASGRPRGEIKRPTQERTSERAQGLRDGTGFQGDPSQRVRWLAGGAHSPGS